MLSRKCWFQWSPDAASLAAALTAVLIVLGATESAAQQTGDTRVQHHEERRRSLFGSRVDDLDYLYNPRALSAPSPFTLSCGPPVYGSSYGSSWPGSWCAPPIYGFLPPPIILAPEERPHRFYERFHPGEGSGMPPLTCDPRSRAGCPPDPRQLPATPLPYVPAQAGLVPGCAEVVVRTVTGAVYEGRLWLPAWGATHPDEVLAALQLALARGAAVSITGRHGYPLYLPPVSYIQSLSALPCR